MPVTQWGPVGSGGEETGKVKSLGTFGARGAGLATYTPPTTTAPNSGATPGTYDVNIFDPETTYNHSKQESEDFFAGLKNALFGTSAPDSQGKHGGALGDTPIVGAVTRAASETVANAAGVVGTIGKGALDVAGGALEHVDVGRPEGERKAQQAAYDSIPADAPYKAEAEAAIKRDPGAAGHYMAKAIEANKEELTYSGKVAPGVTDNLFRAPGSAAESVSNLFGFFGLAQRATERTLAGVGKPSEAGLDRLDSIVAVGQGRMQFNADKGILGTGILAGNPGTGLSPMEAIAFQRYTSHEWSRDQALDFLASHGAGISHNQALQLAGSVVDPTILASAGSALLARGVATGAKLASAVSKAERVLAESEQLLTAARAGGTAEEVAAAMAKVSEGEHLLEAAHGPMVVHGESHALNILGKAAETERGTDIVRALYRVYEPMQQLHMDRMAKVVRTIFDPLSAMGDIKLPGAKETVDLLSEAGTRMYVGAYGDINHLRLIGKLGDLTPGRASPVVDMFTEDLATQAGNVIRTVVGTSQRDAALANGLGDALAKTVPDMEAIEQLAHNAPRSMKEYILREANSVRVRVFDEAAVSDLATRTEQMYGTMDHEGWVKFLGTMNDDMKSLIHTATYGRTQKLVMAAREATKAEGKGGDLADKIDRLIVINRNTLTQQGAGGIVKDIKAAKSLSDKVAVVEAARERYPSLRGFVLDKTSLKDSVERFSDELERTVEHRPMQVIDTELAELGDELAAIHGGAFTLGFAPLDEYKWGLMRTNEAAGKYAPISGVWVDHVAPGLGMGYKPVVTRVAQNVAGKPILGAATKLLKPIDYIDAGITTMRRSISGTVIAESARQRFIAKAANKYSRAGITEELAGNMMKGLDEAVQRNDLVVRASGLTTTQMWNAVEDLIPKHIPRSEFGKRELLDLVLDAYQGDMRHVGITQALSSRVKRVLAFENNNASVLAEQAYPLLKYRLNAIFQAQEKIEPYILNTVRGIVPARGATMNEADKATQRLLGIMEDRSLVSNADHEMAEYSARLLLGNDIEAVARASDSKLGKLTQKLGLNWDALREVKGVKRVNMLRTFRKGLGAEMRKTWEKNQPGLWQDMFEEAQYRAGKGLLDEDEFAVSVLAEQMMGNDVLIGSTADRIGALAKQFDRVDYRAAIAPGEWMRPQNLGALRSLDLDTMAETLRFEVGRGGAVVKTQAEIRAAVASGKLTMDEIEHGLRLAGADPDYISRVNSALTFSWPGFWNTVRHDFNLTKQESTALETMMANAAELRNMTPIDYVSQVLSSKVGLGSNEATVGHMGQLVEIMRKTKKGEVATGDFAPSLSRLNVVEAGGGTKEDLAKQLAHVFAAHLDPSAKRGLLQAFDPELRAAVNDGRIRLDMAEIDNLWDESKDTELARHLLGQLDGTPGDEWRAALPRTPEEYDAAFPARTVPLSIIDTDTGNQLAHTVQIIGDGIRNHPDAAFRDSIVEATARVQQMTPDVPLAHIDITSFESFGIEDAENAVAVTVGTPNDQGAIFLNDAFYGADHATAWADIAAEEATHGTRSSFGGLPRQSNMGAEFSAGSTPLQTLYHEHGHRIDLFMAGEKHAEHGSTVTRTRSQAAKFKAYRKFREEFVGSPANRALSEYSMMHENEAMAELWSLALDPEADLARFNRPIAAEDQLDFSAADNFDEGAPIGFNDAPADILHNNGPQTVEEAVTRLRAVAEKAGVLKSPPPFTTNPDVIRATQMFSKWTKAVIKPHLEGGASPFSDLLDRIAGMPTHAAVPYNATEHELLTAATESMRRKWDDAHRLQYYARERSMLERSINHPMFGIYPASYMWGKMLPEVIRFVAREPFGVRTGAAAYTMMDVQRAVALQREYDPDFDKKLEEMKHSPAMFALGYLMPTMPDEVSAAWPNWARTFAQQGLDMDARVEAGGTVDSKSDVGGTGLNPVEALGKATDLMNPLKPIERTLIAPVKDATKSPADRGEAPVADHVSASELGDPLADAMQTLRGLLGG